MLAKSVKMTVLLFDNFCQHSFVGDTHFGDFNNLQHQVTILCINSLPCDLLNQYWTDSCQLHLNPISWKWPSNWTAHFKNVNNCLNTKIYSYLETSGGQSYNLYLNVVHFSTPVLIRYLWQIKTVVFLHWCLIHAVLLHFLLFLMYSCLSGPWPSPSSYSSTRPPWCTSASSKRSSPSWRSWTCSCPPSCRSCRGKLAATVGATTFSIMTLWIMGKLRQSV